ncbi:hypothetical protein SE17_08170 [Kouleothrix aurantiaca]|jgi:LacI family transcriptional regulator|uniref:HTH lacI-type domain-containing protein n=1 Tax=Kouleothrix aurantiaca TaxID=186479 RepID=A0A0P9DJN0_9CHLR|nr:hypothetical protein SE17_08170 [Kouleothrix aurantiaca]
MSQSLTIEEIASLAQVSRSTVSRVLNEHPNVRASVRERVLQVISEQNYAPRAAARSLANNRTQSLCFLFPNKTSSVFEDPFFAMLMQGMLEVANRRGYFVMLSAVAPDMEQDFYRKVLRSRPFDGLIMLASVEDDPLLPMLLRDRMPFVLCERHPYLRNVSWIEIDNRESAREAVLHLLKLGHRRIGTITGPLNTSSGVERRDGYKQALLEHGIGIAPELIIEGDYHPDGGFAGMQRLLQLPDPPTAMFIASDLMAIGAMRALRAAGLRVPHDTAIVSFDDLPAARFADVPLTTVHQPIRDIGLNATDILIDQLEQQDFTPTFRRMPTKLIIRDSCGASLRTGA